MELKAFLALKGGKNIMRDKKGQMAIGLGDAPQVVMIVGFVFLIMATVAYVSHEYGDAIDPDSEGIIAANVTDALEGELDDNTDIAGVVLTIALVGIILAILIGIFVQTRRGGL